MKRSSIGHIILGVFLISTGLHGSELRCLGSDGGTPFSNVTHDVSVKQHILPSFGLIKDFVFQDNLDQLVYRNIKDQIRVLRMADFQDRFVSYAEGKLSRVTDSESGKVLASNTTTFLDVEENGPEWQRFGNGSSVREHLFWGNNTVYSLENYWVKQNERYHFKFLSYSPGKNWVHHCDAGDIRGQNVKLAQGNQFPYLHFYSLKKGLLGNKVIVYRMAVNQVGYGGACPIEEVTQYPESDLGTIKAFYHFNIDGVDAFAFHLADPKKNLFWDKPGECAYYNFKGKTPIFISPKHPVFATWRNGEGLSIHSLDNKTAVTLFSKIEQSQFGSENLWLSRDGKTLYSSFVTGHHRNGKLVVATDLLGPR
jgi:hypothetical protein